MNYFKISALFGLVFAQAACQTTVTSVEEAASTAPEVQVSQLAVAFADPAWDGRRVPHGQECSRDGGNGSTPPLTVSNIPPEADVIVVEFNDKSYQPLSYNGGHGKIGFQIASGQSTATLPAVPGWSTEMPAGAFIVANNRGYVKTGYAPPCSGGGGNRYVAIITAQKDGVTLAESGVFELGRY